MVAGSPSDAPVAPRRWQRPHQSVQVHIFSARPVSGREDVAVMAMGWAWQFQKDLREAYVWHRSIGESRRLRALACAWRTALILMTGSSVTPARSLLGATLSGLARRTRADVAARESSNAKQINVHLSSQHDLLAARDTISRHPRISRSVLHRSLHLLSTMAAAIVDAAVIAVAAGASVSIYTQRIESGMQAMFVAFVIVGVVLSYRVWRTHRAERMMFFGRQNARRDRVRWIVPGRTQPFRLSSPPHLVTKVRTFYKLHEPHVFRIPISLAPISRALSACLQALRERAIAYRHGLTAGMTAVGIWAQRTSSGHHRTQEAAPVGVSVALAFSDGRQFGEGVCLRATLDSTRPRVMGDDGWATRPRNNRARRKEGLRRGCTWRPGVQNGWLSPARRTCGRPAASPAVGPGAD